MAKRNILRLNSLEGDLRNVNGVFILFVCFGCKFLCSKTKIHGLDRFHENGPNCEMPSEKEPIKAHGFANKNTRLGPFP